MSMKFQGDVKPKLVCGEGRTKQSEAKSCDMNYIVDKYRRTGFAPSVSQHQGVFADVSMVPDLHTTMQKVVNAQVAFDRLPAKVRFRFGNDYMNLVDFVKDERNYEEAVALGLVEKKVVVKEPEADPGVHPVLTKPA